MRPKALLALIATLVVTFASVPASGADVEPALSSGDTVTFLVPQGTQVTSGPQGDVVHFIGHPVGAIQVTGCVADTDQHPIQTVVLVDPGSGTLANRQDVIVASQTMPVPPGTKLENLVMENSCAVTGVVYDKYTGTVN
jgi:hypothetical protein